MLCALLDRVAAAATSSLLRQARGAAVALAAVALLTSCQEPDWAEREATLTAIEKAHDRGDNAEFVRLGKSLAAQCDVAAQTWIGLFILMGAGEAATPEERQREGLMLLHEAADVGNPITQSFLRDIYRKGEYGVPKDENLGSCDKLAVGHPDWGGVCATMVAVRGHERGSKCGLGERWSSGSRIYISGYWSLAALRD